MSSPRRRLCNRLGTAVGAVLAVIVAVSCGSSNHTASTAGSESATAPLTSTAAPAPGAAAKTTSAAQPTTPAPTPNSTPSTSVHPVAPSRSGQLLRRFTGYGNARLGTIFVHARSRLLWNAQHAGIQIFTSNGFQLVNTHSQDGAVRLSRGTYRGVRVSSAARWSIELRSES